MPSARRDPVAATTGAVAALLALLLSVVAARGLERLAHGERLLGLILVALSGVARAALSLVEGLLAERWGARARDEGRARLRDDLSRPHDGARPDLVAAVDAAALSPALDLIEARGRVGLVGLAIVAWAGGWLDVAVVAALMAGAVPLYRRAGRRTLDREAEYRRRRDRLEERQLAVLTQAGALRGLGAVEYGAEEIAALSNSEHTLARRALAAAMGSALVTEFLAGVSVGLVAMIEGFALLGGRTSLLRALVAVLGTAEVVSGLRRAGVTFHQREIATRGRERLEGIGASGEGGALSAGATLRARALRTAHSDSPVDLDLTGRERVLVTGPSGSGKSTLLETLVGWRIPESGLLERQGRLAFVSPASRLLAAPLAENLLAEGRREEARATLESLGLTGPRFADLDAPLGADGHGLSEGERVRVLVARGLLGGARLILLDDVAGLLDPASRAALAGVLVSFPGPVVEACAGPPLLDAPTQVVQL